MCYRVTMIGLRIHQTLAERGITAYRLWKESGLAKNTAYAFAAAPGERTQVDLGKLSAVVSAIEKISERPVPLAEIFELSAQP